MGFSVSLKTFRHMFGHLMARFRTYQSTPEEQLPTPEVLPTPEQAAKEIEREAEMIAWREQCRQASLRRQKDLHDRKENETRRLAELEAQKIKAAAKAKSEGFYQSYEWRSLRYDAFEKYGRICRICGRTPESHDVVLHVDHIKPRSKYPSLRLEIENLQILCEDCNLGKGVKDDI